LITFSLNLDIRSGECVELFFRSSEHLDAVVLHASRDGAGLDSIHRYLTSNPTTNLCLPQTSTSARRY